MPKPSKEEKAVKKATKPSLAIVVTVLILGVIAATVLTGDFALFSILERLIVVTKGLAIAAILVAIILVVIKYWHAIEKIKI